jgi:hypothetical protein
MLCTRSGSPRRRPGRRHAPPHGGRRWAGVLVAAALVGIWGPAQRAVATESQVVTDA